MIYERLITEWKVNLKDSRLTLEQKEKFYVLKEENHDAFSLQDEIQTYQKGRGTFEVAQWSVIPYSLICNNGGTKTSYTGIY